MMQMDGGMMGAIMGMGWIWTLVGILAIVLLAILIIRAVETLINCANVVVGFDEGVLRK